ncbi:hypothetical protein ABZV80_24315 [Streptomyces sp. NPDC005132]|uniref:hypothetical protein n=1 Tax=Streptomyces sp. NPDC005132 TaxID=3154294 RepID=UPI0033BE72B5
MPTDVMDLIVHSAGRDHELRLAMEDLQMDRWLSARQLLRTTGTNWGLRTARSQVLAVGAAQSHAIEAWRQEEPESVNAVMMWARVLTQRALRAFRDGVRGDDLRRATYVANQACRTAAIMWPADPVPGVCLLALAQTDVDRLWPHDPLNWVEHRDGFLPPGPWTLLNWVHARDPYNREAYHRTLQVLQARGTGDLDFALWVASTAPEGAAVTLLPLYAFVDRYRRSIACGRTASVIAFWATEDKAHYARRGLEWWFNAPTPTTGAAAAGHGQQLLEVRSLADLHYLAHALTATGVGHAADVFAAIGPYATPAPWAYVGTNPDWWMDDFRSARTRALNHR